MEKKEMILELIRTSDVVYLATLAEDDCPEVRAMVNLRNKLAYPKQAKVIDEFGEEFTLYFVTTRSMSKTKQIAANAATAVYLCRPGVFHGVMLKGTAKTVEDMAIKEKLWDDTWKIYYPAGVNDPECVVIKFVPKRGRGWSGTKPFEVELC